MRDCRRSPVKNTYASRLQTRLYDDFSREPRKAHATHGEAGTPNLPIFQAGNGKLLNLHNLVRREIVPALTRCEVCGKAESGHAKAEHEFKLDTSIPSWHGWHASRRGLATNLHTLGLDDKTIQAILRHSNVALTISVYIKSVTESQVSAMGVRSQIPRNFQQPSSGQSEACELSERNDP